MDIFVIKCTGRGLVVKRPGVLSKVQMLDLVLGVGVFSLLPKISLGQGFGGGQDRMGSSDWDCPVAPQNVLIVDFQIHFDWASVIRRVPGCPSQRFLRALSLSLSQGPSQRSRNLSGPLAPVLFENPKCRERKCEERTGAGPFLETILYLVGTSAPKKKKLAPPPTPDSPQTPSSPLAPPPTPWGDPPLQALSIKDRPALPPGASDSPFPSPRAAKNKNIRTSTKFTIHPEIFTNEFPSRFFFL